MEFCNQPVHALHHHVHELQSGLEQCTQDIGERKSYMGPVHADASVSTTTVLCVAS